ALNGKSSPTLTSSFSSGWRQGRTFTYTIYFLTWTLGTVSDLTGGDTLIKDYHSAAFYRFSPVNRGILQRKGIASLRGSTSQALFFMGPVRQRTGITPQARSQWQELVRWSSLFVPFVMARSVGF